MAAHHQQYEAISLQLLDNIPSLAARDAYLNALPLEEQIHVLRQAERVGPLPSDPDWLIAHAVERAASRIEHTVNAFEARMDVVMNNAPDANRRPSKRFRSSLRDIWIFSASLGTFSGVACFVERYALHAQLLVLYSSAIALGAAASALYFSLTKWISRK